MIYCYPNLRWSQSFCLSWGDIYLPLGISLHIYLSFSVVTVSELFSCEVFETPACLLAIKSPVASAVFWIVLFEVVLKWIYRRLFSIITTFLTLFTTEFFIYNVFNFLLIFKQTIKIHRFFTNSRFARGCHFLYFNYNSINNLSNFYFIFYLFRLRILIIKSYVIIWKSTA